MAIAIWNKRFETGILEIDEQHRRLFEAVNKLHEAIKAGTAAAQLKETLEFIISYTVEHFQTEERHMQRIRYPKYSAHVAKHSELIGKANSLQLKMVMGAPMTVEVTAFLADWLRHHINEEDLDYVAFARGNAKSA